MPLPINIDATYEDDAMRPGRKLHQQHHDLIHKMYNHLEVDELYDARDYGAVLDNVTDDTAAIQAAINAAEAAGRGDVLVADTAVVNGTLNIRNPGVGLVAGSIGKTTFRRVSGTSPFLSISPTAGQDRLRGLRFNNLTFDGANLVLRAVTCDRMYLSEVRKIRFLNCVDVGWDWIVADGGTLNVGNSFNICSGWSCDNTGRLMRLNGNTAGTSNTCHNTFMNMVPVYKGEAGIEMVDCDNNSFWMIFTFRASGSGRGVVFKGRARSNYIFHYQGTMLVHPPEVGNDACNVVYGYDRENSQPPPELLEGAKLTWYETGANADGTQLAETLHVNGNFAVPLFGTVSVTNGSTLVTGTGSSFNTQITTNDAVKINNEVFTVVSVASTTEMELDSPYLGATASGLTAWMDDSFMVVKNGDGAKRFELDRRGAIIGPVGSEFNVSAAGGQVFDINDETGSHVRLFVNNKFFLGQALQVFDHVGGNDYLSLLHRGSHSEIFNNPTSDPLNFCPLGGNVGIGINTGDVTARLQIHNDSATRINLLVRGMIGQTGDLTRWEDVNEAKLLAVESTGIFRLANNNVDGYLNHPGSPTNVLKPFALTSVGLSVRGVSRTTGVTNKELTSNVATLTTAANPNNFVVGRSVTVSGVDATFDGTYTIASVPTANTFTYAKTAPDVASQSASGTATSYTQSNDLTQWQEANNVLAKVGALGDAFFRSLTGSDGVELDIKAATGQTLDLNDTTGSHVRLFVNNGGSSQALQIYDNVASSNDYLSILHAGAQAEIFTSNTADPLALQATGGNVAIGVLTATAKLQVHTADAAKVGLILRHATLPTANFLEIQSSAPAVLTKITPTGILEFTSNDQGVVIPTAGGTRYRITVTSTGGVIAVLAT